MIGFVRRWFDPVDLRQAGERPDYRFSLANERTFLAWIRTGLALVGGGLAVAQFLPPHGGLRTVLAIALLLLGALVALRAVDHWARAELAMRRREELPTSRFPGLLSIVVGAGALALAVAVLAGVLG
ncbi:YidH family protein [Rhizomonospora bruguierae]|uniref:YidH family protein n=1 Tax=Rhizomonospora bruguierae TaxID=1581705 RepID=UPI001BCE6F2A|nr:DUF202 domain-containing protein [Micromonospora sp. NBRC 107566]